MEEIQLWRILWEPALQWRWEELQETLQLPCLPFCGIVILWCISLCNLINGPFELRHFDIRFDLLQAEATSEGSQEYFDDIVSLLRARKGMRSSNGGVTFGIYHVEVGLSGSQESDFVHNITRHKSEVWSIDPQVNMFDMTTSAISFVSCFKYITMIIMYFIIMNCLWGQGLVIC